MPQEKLFFRCEGTIDPITEAIEIQTVECPESQKWEPILRNRLIRRRWAISVRKLFLWFLLVGFGAVFAGLYGALHNQISYTVAPEYFTVIKFSQLGILKILRENKDRLTEKYGLTKLGLFGSFARGTAAEDSDIDICFDTASMQPFAATHIKEEFELLFHHSVDIVQPHPFMRALFLQRLEKEVIYV